MTSRSKLNRDKPYAVVRGGGDQRFLQDGHYFDHKGDVCGEVDPHFTKRPKRAAPAKPKSEKSKEDVLSRAADKLDMDNKTRVGNVQADAAKENAAARAAEENA